MSQAAMILQSIKFIKENHGWKAIPGFLLRSIIEDISGYILVGALKDAIPPVPPKLPLEIREATPEDAFRFRNIIPPYRIHRFVKKMRNGERCAVGLLNDEVIYFAWASFAGQPTSVESPIKLGPRMFISGGPIASQSTVALALVSASQAIMRI